MLMQTVPGGGSLTVPMSFEEYEALGETKHTAYYDQLAHVNPPTLRHVRIARRLTRLLEDAVGPDHEVLPEAGWALAARTTLVPDIVVARRDQLALDVLHGPPLLVVEVLSRSTRGEDLGRKRELYAQGGADWYWVADPDSDTILVLERQGDAYEQRDLVRTGVYRVQTPVSVLLDLERIFA